MGKTKQNKSIKQQTVKVIKYQWYQLRFMSADRYNFHQKWEHLQQRHVGTGNPNITKFEWAVNQHRDTIATHVGHHDQLFYFATAQNESVQRIKYQMLEKFVMPCGPPPPQEG